MRWSELRWPEVAELPARRLVGILPVGAVEAHGPHLPLNTDEVIALAMAEEGGALLARAGWTAVLLPPISYVAAPFAASFPGTFSLSPELVTRLVLEVAENWARHGARALVLANAHLDPAHLKALEQARLDAAERLSMPVVFPNLARRPWALRLTEEFLSGACHAGCYETSIVLATRPDLVRMDLAHRLPANSTSLSEGIRQGKASFEELGGHQAYFGDPAAATEAEGRRTLSALGGIVADAALAVLGEAP
ncbi:MAG: creatininase family protein [Thermoanaerobaculia bacterium]